MKAVKAGVCYFALIFALAFLLGVIRVRLIAPNWGDMVGIAIEVPIILVLAWIACRYLVRQLRVPATVGARLTMGVVALGLVLLADMAVALILGHRSLTQHLAQYRTQEALFGLAAQLVFAAMPLMRLALTQRRSS